jgi:DNA-binding LacI/PurR family transcriptional regulator
LFAHADPPTAIVAASDLQAIGGIEAARDSGRVLGEDLSLIGFDDIDMASFVGLSTVRQPLERSGQRGAELLLSSLNADSRPRPFNERLPLELIVRQTTGPRAARQQRTTKR